MGGERFIVKKILLLLWSLFAVTGCYASSVTNTPGGKTSSHMYMAGMVTTSETDTMVSFDRCREIVKPGHPGEEPMVDREVYDKCFADAMKGVAPMGQRPDATPVDLNGDGRPDVVRYTDGTQVPYGLWSMYPNVNFPQVYGYYGYGATGGYGSSMGYGPTSYVMPAPLGPNEYSGSFLVVGEADPTQAGYARYNQAAPPLVGREEYEQDMHTVAKRVYKNTRTIGCLSTRRDGACSVPSKKAKGDDKKPEATAADANPSE